MKYFNKKQMAMLKEVERHLITSALCAYKKSTTVKQNEMVADIWDEYTQSKTERSWGCGVCAFKLYKKVGEVYIATQENEKVEEKPKRGRPKKDSADTISKDADVQTDKIN